MKKFLTLALLASSFTAMAADMSNGANNFFFKSDKVTEQKVSFNNQYRMKVVGNLYVPKNLNKANKKPCDYHWPPDGCGQRAKLKPLRSETR